MPRSLIAFIVVVVALGAGAIVQSASLIHPASLANGYVALLVALTLASGRFAIKMPGRPATVSVSEVFVFASILLFGAPVAVLTVAIDGLWTSLTHRDRRLYRTLFNIAEPAVTTWAAAHAFFGVAGIAQGVSVTTGMPGFVPATLAMAAVFFVLNSGLSAVAMALENGASSFRVWRSHAWYLAINYHAAASVASLAISTGPHVNFSVVGLVAPLLVLSYVAYREASTRIDAAQRHVADADHLYRASVEMLAIAVDAKDQVTHGHIRRVQRHTLAVAAALGITDPRELKAIEAGALLHDIGKLAVPDYVLNKPTGLTHAEFETMKKHASMGARILTAVDFPYPIVPIVRHHHEQWDGRGYPDGLVGPEIPLGARILAVVDCFDALTTDRPYRSRLTDERAIEILRARAGTFYDPAVVETFVERIPELRREDAASHEHRDAQASMVAGLTRLKAGDIGEPEARRAVPGPTVGIASGVRELIDDEIGRLGSADACLFAVNVEQNALVLAHATPRIREAVSGVQLPIGSGVSGWVAAYRNTIQQADPVLDISGLAGAFALKSCASVPVFVRANLFGVLAVYVTDTAIPDETVAAVGLIAQEIGLMIARGAPARAQSHSRATARWPIVAAS